MSRIVVVLLALWSVAATAQNVTDPALEYDNDANTAILYHFDLDEGATVSNDGPPALFGNVNGGQWVAEGKYGGGWQMDGTTKIEPARSLLFTRDDLTMEAWIYPTDRQGSVFLIDATGQVEDGTQGRLLGIDVDGRPFAFAVQPFFPPRVAQAPFPIPLNEWTHVAAIFSDSTDQMWIAVNGCRQAFHPILDEEDGLDRVAIGRSLGIPDPRGLIGRIDEVRISTVDRELDCIVPIEATSWGAVKARY